MCNELHDIFEEAINYCNTANLDGFDYKARLSYGIKIVKYDDDNSIVIYNTAKGGDYYEELTEEQYDVFFKEGWKVGVLKMALERYTNKLTLIENKIKEEINGRNNANYLNFLKETRTQTLNNYYNVTQKLNQDDKPIKNN
jgi:hypothetical protein